MSEVNHVPLLDLTRLDADLEGELKQAFAKVLASGRFILGGEVEALEKECAEYIGVRHSVGVSSGTDALLLALMALGIGPGDEVICPSHSFFATAGSIWRTGANVVFVDILPGSFNCDPAAVARKITAKTRVIMPVHLFGQCADMDPVLEAAGERGIAVIEDAAQAIGSEYGGRRAGAIGDLGCFSFFPSKNLGALGDAGLIATNDDELADKLRVLRVHGGHTKYHHRLVGGNFRIDALQAALLRPKLRRLDDWTARRQQNAERLTRLLTDAGVGMPSPLHDDGSVEAAPPASEVPLFLPVAGRNRHIFNQYTIRVRGDGVRDRLRQFLTEHGIGTEIYYPVPLHLQECFKALGHKEGDFPVAEAAARETLAVPIFPELRTEEIQYVVDTVVAFFRQDKAR